LRILSISALFPPNVQGGAEISAYNLAQWLSSNGNEVAVLTTATSPEDEVFGVDEGGLRVWRIFMPRAYTAFDASKTAAWKKPVWHLQDIFDPRNKAIFEKIVDEFRPDFVSVHYIQGLGFNILTSIGKRNLPAAVTFHDLSLACIKMSMFVDGKECEGLCTSCALSAKVKMSYVRGVKRIGFISPSKAVLDKMLSLQPISQYPRAHIPNARRYPAPQTSYRQSDKFRFVYVGRLTEAKGVNVLLEALEPLVPDYDFTLKMVGTGPEAETLRERYAGQNWISFTGHVPADQVPEIMADSDLLFVPSIWLENSPGVVIQALGLSLPVMGSDKGGIPELVQHNENGILVPPGDVAAWRSATKSLLDDPERLRVLRENAKRGAAEFDADRLAGRIFSFFEKIRALP
jgi:glycosyltransferase involved in cell wall biosynthesis